jgi:hypothetical protein
MFSSYINLLRNREIPLYFLPLRVYLCLPFQLLATRTPRWAISCEIDLQLWFSSISIFFFPFFLIHTNNETAIVFFIEKKIKSPLVRAHPVTFHLECVMNLLQNLNVNAIFVIYLLPTPVIDAEYEWGTREECCGGGKPNFKEE